MGLGFGNGVFMGDYGVFMGDYGVFMGLSGGCGVSMGQAFGYGVTMGFPYPPILPPRHSSAGQSALWDPGWPRPPAG